VQQLREGINNFFVTFVEVLEDREGGSRFVEPGITSGDYLSGFLQGTREALSEAGRESLTITVEQISARTIGVLIALYERAVGFYASLVRINAYHQPGVEAGKKAAGEVLVLQKKVLSFLSASREQSFTAKEIGSAIGHQEKTEQIFRILLHLAANPDHAVVIKKEEPLWGSRFSG